MGWSKTKHFRNTSIWYLRFSLREVWGEWGRSEKAAEGMRGGVSCIRSRVLWGGSGDSGQRLRLWPLADPVAECTRRQAQSLNPRWNLPRRRNKGSRAENAGQCTADAMGKEGKMGPRTLGNEGSKAGLLNQDKSKRRWRKALAEARIRRLRPAGQQSWPGAASGPCQVKKVAKKRNPIRRDLGSTHRGVSVCSSSLRHR